MRHPLVVKLKSGEYDGKDIMDSWLLIERLTALLHSKEDHPDFEYYTTEGQRKVWDGENDLPDGDGWEKNTDAGDDGWMRFTYHEEAYWRRLKVVPIENSS